MIKSKVSLAVLTALTTCALSTTAAAQTQPGEDNVELIQVRGIQGSLRQAAFQKQTSDVIQDSIVAEDIGKFPDQNVAESLQRITGVSISRVNGEGSQISVRSFGPEFNVVKLNDRT
ncbi:MAG: TonB-dependent receptor plug domain-containing protein, partial [Aestuariibacter sp.]|nr:TonB-dependent receptor plug domain-containing protein [Aestuariibacter sp.]